MQMWNKTLSVAQC